MSKAIKKVLIVPYAVTGSSIEILVKMIVRRSTTGVIASGNELLKNAVERDRLGREFGAKCVEMDRGNELAHELGQKATGLDRDIPPATKLKSAAMREGKELN
jgi:hypothetical protein